MRPWLFACWLLLLPLSAAALPLQTPILTPAEEQVGTALVYIDYVELLDPSQRPLGKVAFVIRDGFFEMMLVRQDEKKTISGRAANRRLYNEAGELIALYDWTSFWVYVYGRDGKALGKAKCLAFRGVCAAGVAGYLSGLFGPPSS